jgi:2-polyprenyl-3-methyl-5-hydroxy-6-metoxy-1,4-benzoquinol methylase
LVDFNEVLAAWEADAKAGGKSIHPFDPDSREFWDLGWAQAEQVAQYAKPGARVVDFGAGIGRLSIPLVSMGYDVIAVDASASMLEELKRRAKDAGVEVATALSDGDLSKVLGRRKADVILARAVLIHHDYEGVERIVTQLSKALKKGGHLIADWPLGASGERKDWIDVTTWQHGHRLEVAQRAGLDPVDSGDPSVWRKL